MSVQMAMFAPAANCSHPDSVSRACLTGVCARSEQMRGQTFQLVSAFPLGARIRDVHWLSEYVIERVGNDRKPWKLRCVAPGLKPDRVGELHDNYDNDPRYEWAGNAPSEKENA